MESENTTAVATQPTLAPAPAVQPLAAWFNRLGVSGKLLSIAALAGIIATFLPASTLSMETSVPKGFNKAAPNLAAGNLGMSTSKSTMVVENWRGQLELVGFAAALGVAFLIYPTSGSAPKPLCWAAVGASSLAALLGLWLLVLVLNAGGGADMGFVSIKSSPGIGLFISFIAGIAATTGAFLKAREEKLI